MYYLPLGFFFAVAVGVPATASRRTVSMCSSRIPITKSCIDISSRAAAALILLCSFVGKKKFIAVALSGGIRGICFAAKITYLRGPTQLLRGYED